jgi:hypothetical protein
MEKKQDDRAHEIAVSIYVQLVARNTEITQESVKLTASASNIATLSLRLSEAFLEAEAAAIAARAPVTNYTVQGEDIAKWSK